MPDDLLAGPTPEEHDHGCKCLLQWPADTTTTAVYGGANKCFRYLLEQVWDAKLPVAAFGMMNPSGASEHVGDSTVIRTGQFARRWGYGGQIVFNACAYRRTDNTDLCALSDPQGPENIKHILEAAGRAKLIVIGHGRLPGELQPHADTMVAALRGAGHKLHVLRLSKRDIPYHPLARGKGWIPDGAQPILWGAA